MSEQFTEKEKYLVYKIQDELYASPLLDFREVIEYTSPKIVPNMASYFIGMINLRGLIIGVVDLRKKLGYESQNALRPSLLICETEDGPIGATIDKVEFVLQLLPQDIQELKIEGRVDVAFLKGFIQHGEHLITIVDIRKLISNFDDRIAPGEAA
jgi:purine-binding chemotaxis protein CheW